METANQQQTITPQQAQAVMLNLGEAYHRLDETYLRLAKERIPFALAVQVAPPEQKALMQSALDDFDRQAKVALRERVQAIKEGLLEGITAMQGLAATADTMLSQLE
jgi:hypothetical protein